jgi:hypothetical protein
MTSIEYNWGLFYNCGEFKNIKEQKIILDRKKFILDTVNKAKEYH